MQVKFLGELCEITVAQYANKRLAILLVCVDGSPMAHCTVNLIERPLEEGYVFVKSYSENEGMLGTLIRDGIVKEPEYFVASGFVNIPCCQLTDTFKESIKGNSL